MAEKSAKTGLSKRASNKAPGAKPAAGNVKAKTSVKPAAKKRGAGPAKKKTTFKLHAPGASQVFVAGCFNDWDPIADALAPGGEGTWTCTLSLEPGEHEYRFVVDGVWWDDPMAEMRRPNPFGCENCVIIV